MTEADRHTGELVKKDRALAGAAVSAAVGLAVYAMRKALAEGEGGRSLREREEERDRDQTRRPLLGTTWDSVPDAVLPLAEDAAEAAGRWVAKNSPALIRDRLLPRFIDSFKASV
jgi:hypothetical protein